MHFIVCKLYLNTNIKTKNVYEHSSTNKLQRDNASKQVVSETYKTNQSIVICRPLISNFLKKLKKKDHL